MVVHRMVPIRLGGLFRKPGVSVVYKPIDPVPLALYYGTRVVRGDPAVITIQIVSRSGSDRCADR